MVTINVLLFVCVLICPVIAAIAGFIMMTNPPKEINNAIGYRTKRSKSSQEAWDFANVYCGKNTLIYGIVSFFISAALYYVLTVFVRLNSLVAMNVVIFIQIVCMVVVMVVPTEKKLKEKFGDR